MDVWGWILLALLMPGPLWGATPHMELLVAGGQVLLSCGAVVPPLRWIWSPQYPDCAGVTEDLPGIAQLSLGPEVPPGRFGARLAPHPSILGALLLRDLVMSDSGTFLCLGVAGAHRSTRLEVMGGCRNNLTVSSEQTSRSTLILRCGHCPTPANSTRYKWLINGRPLGNRPWANKSQRGAVVHLDPTRPAAWGRWECQPLADPSRTFEFCLVPPQGAGDIGLSPQGRLWVVVTAAVLVLSGAWLGAWCLWRWRRARKRRDQKKQENETGDPSPTLSPLEEPREGDRLTGKSPISQRGEGKVLLYAEVQHPPAVSAPLLPLDGATVYATIV